MAKNEELTIDALKDKTPEEQEILMALAEQLLEMTKTKVKKVNRASDEDWAKIKKSEHVVTMGKELKAKTKATMTMEDLESLIDSAKSKRHLTGTIVGVRSIDSGDSDPDGSKAKALAEAAKKNGSNASDFEKPEMTIKTWVAEVRYGNDTVQVLIPSYQLYAYNVSDNRTPEGEEIIHRHLQDMVGCEIEFVARHVDKAKKICFASRLQALDDNGWGNYIRQTKSGKPRITEGSIAEAKVVAVRNHAVIVDVGGAETVLQANKENNNLSWGYVDNCHKLFKINDVIPVKVLALRQVKHRVYNESYNIMQVKVSYKDTQTNPMDEYWDTIHEGEIGLAEITRISDARVFCKYKGRVDILCKAPQYGARVMVGDTRKVQITIKKTTETGEKRIFGIFVSE